MDRNHERLSPRRRPLLADQPKKPPLPVRKPGATKPPKPRTTATPRAGGRVSPTGYISLPRASALPTIWLATPAGLVDIDTIAVERAMNGDRHGWTLTEDEARYAAEIMFEHQVPYSVIATRIGKSTETLRRWFPEKVVPARPTLARPGLRKEIECGTPRGYRAHHRRKETPCERCKGANAAADRYYRAHGTTAGAPGVAA